VVRGLSGVPIYQDRLGVNPEKIPYGDDPTRWIPELSALLVQTEGLLSSQVIERISGGDGLKVTYAPFEGRVRTVDLSDPKYRMGIDFWWARPPSNATLDRLLAAALFVLAAVAAAALYLQAFGRRWPLRKGARKCAAA
jgi:hypothetical protein